MIVPNPLWDRANVLDSIAYAVTDAAGPALAGGLTAWYGPRVALLALGGVLHRRGACHGRACGTADPWWINLRTGRRL